MHIKALPIVVFALVVATITTTYVVSCSLGHTKWWLPMISQTGMYPPEASIFSLGLSISGCLIFIIVYTRFIQVQKVLKTRNLKNCSWRFHQFLNYIQLLVGAILSLALITLCTFSVSNVPEVHNPVALIFFFASCIHLSLTTRLYRYADGEGRTGIFVLRILLTIGAWAALATALAFLVIQPLKEQTHLRVYGALMEWVCVTMLVFYWVTYYFDLRRASAARITVTDSANDYTTVNAMSGSYSHYSRLIYN